MTSRDFCYWLQGFFEIGRAHEPGNHAPALTERQAEMIRKHLALVFQHEIDPSAGPPEHQAALNAIHSPDGTPFANAVSTSARPPIGGVGPQGQVYRC